MMTLINLAAILLVITAFVVYYGESSSDSESDKKGTKEMLMIVVIALIVIGWLNVSINQDRESLTKQFKLEKDIYCKPSSLDSKKIRVNKKDGWYLEDGEYLKHKEMQYSINIEHCEEKF